MDWIIEELGNLSLGDKRLDRRAQRILVNLNGHMINLIKDTLDLTHTKISIEVNTFFYANVFRYFGVSLPVVTNATNLIDQQQFLNTLNKTLNEKLNIKKSLDLLIIDNDTITLHTNSTQFLPLLLLSLTPSWLKIDFAPQYALDNLNMQTPQYTLTEQKHCDQHFFRAKVMGVVGYLDGYARNDLWLNLNQKKKKQLLKELIREYINYISIVVDKTSANQYLVSLKNKILHLKTDESTLFMAGFFNNSRSSEILTRTEQKANALIAYLKIC